MNKTDLITAVAEKAGLTKKDVEKDDVSSWLSTEILTLDCQRAAIDRLVQELGCHCLDSWTIN